GRSPLSRRCAVATAPGSALSASSFAAVLRQKIEQRRAMIWDRSLLRAAAQRGRMAGQFEALAGIGQRGAVDLQDREIPVDEIADIEIAAVGAEGAALGKCSDIDLAGIGDFFAVDLERGDRTCRVIERGTLHV